MTKEEIGNHYRTARELKGFLDYEIEAYENSIRHADRFPLAENEADVDTYRSNITHAIALLVEKAEAGKKKG